MIITNQLCCVKLSREGCSFDFIPRMVIAQPHNPIYPITSQLNRTWLFEYLESRPDNIFLQFISGYLPRYCARKIE